MTSLAVATASLLVRRFTPADAPRLFAMSQQPGMRAWIPDQVYDDERHASRVLAHLIAAYDSTDGPARAPMVLGVCLQAGGDLIGHVGLSATASGVEIGYAIDEAHQGKGYATEAVRAVAGWGLRSFRLRAIEGVVASGNRASCRVLEKAGFRLLGESVRSLHGADRLVRTYCFSR